MKELVVPMKFNNRTSLIIIVLILLLAIPLTVWLVLNTTGLLDRRAAENEVTVTFVPPTIETSLGKPVTVEVYLNTNGIPVSGATIALTNLDAMGLTLESISFVTENPPYDEIIYSQEENPHQFTLLSKRPDAELPTGTVKIATVSYTATGPGTIPISINTAATDIVGVQTDSSIVQMTPVGTESSVSVSGSLCRIEQCVNGSGIQLVEQPRDDRKYNVRLSWDTAIASGSSQLFYKTYRGIGAPVAASHSDTDLVSTTVNTHTLDTNANGGFEGSQQIHYDIDTYIVCPNG